METQLQEEENGKTGIWAEPHQDLERERGAHQSLPVILQVKLRHRRGTCPPLGQD
jgi:hypothetical protein